MSPMGSSGTPERAPAVDLFIACVPPKTTAQGKRLVMTPNGPRFFHKGKHLEEQNTLAALLSPHRPERPIAAPVALLVEATWPWRKDDLSTRAKRLRAEAVGRIPNDQKPDFDNFTKMVVDTLVALGFIPDDRCVADGTVRKFFGARPGIRIRIECMEDAGG